MAEFDLSQLNGGRNNNRVDTIDTTSGKIQRSGNYISANEARAKGMSISGEPKAKDYDPIFDTPPTFKVAKPTHVQNLGEAPQPVETVKHVESKAPVVHTKETKPDVPDPVPLKVVDNFAVKLNESIGSSDEVTPFDPKSLPKKKPQISHDEAEDMALLEKAVEREKKSITERVRALTEAQYNELIDAQQKGIQISRPMTDEEVAAEEEARVNNNPEAEKVPIEERIQKRIIIDDDSGEEATFEEPKYKEVFEDNCMNAIRYVDMHVNAKDYFTRTMHLKSYLSNQHQYSELWAIVMYDKEGNTAVHPFLVSKKDGITAIVECNLDNIKGVHVLDPNDSIETLYVEFQHKGYLYEYIDFLANSVVVKLPSDMPTTENALKLANEKLGAKKQMDNIKDNEPEVIEAKITEDTHPYIENHEDLKDAINTDEASTLYSDEYDTSDTSVDGVSYFTTDDVPFEMSTSTNADSDTVYEDYQGENEDSVESGDDSSDADIDESVVISKEYSGRSAFEEAASDDLEKDLKRELRIDEDEDKTNEDMLNELKAAVKKNIPAIKKKINLRDFKIADTPISAAQVASFSISDLNEADWVLPNANKVITVRGLSGPELFAMNPQNSNKNKINTFRQIYGIIYKHITSLKPNTFDEWLKVTRFSDIDHIYAALHRATFSGSNFVHYECPECHHVFVREYPFEDMVNYRDEKAKLRITQLLNSADTSIPGYDVKLVQISDRYVVGLKDPSVWNMVMETAALSESFLTKYEDLLDTMSFIDSIYLIDHDTMKLSPIDFDYKKEDPAQSTARKIIILSDLIKSLSSDSYFNLRNQIAQMFASSNDISYKIPAAVCDHCQHEFSEEPTEGMRMLFTRHQLGALGVI